MKWTPKIPDYTGSGLRGFLRSALLALYAAGVLALYGFLVIVWTVHISLCLISSSR